MYSYIYCTTELAMTGSKGSHWEWWYMRPPSCWKWVLNDTGHYLARSVKH